MLNTMFSILEVIFKYINFFFSLLMNINRNIVFQYAAAIEKYPLTRKFLLQDGLIFVVFLLGAFASGIYVCALIIASFGLPGLGFLALTPLHLGVFFLLPSLSILYYACISAQTKILLNKEQKK